MTQQERVARCVAAIREKTGFAPRTALILGSGLGAFGERLRLEAAVEYKDLPGFPVSTGRRVATCAVSTGLEASWVLDYTLTDDGWRCAAVKGPLEGGYRVHEGKPEEQK